MGDVARWKKWLKGKEAEKTPKRRAQEREWARAWVGQRLRDVRRDWGLTQLQVADWLGVSPGRVSKWERNLETPPPLFRERLASEFMYQSWYFGRPAGDCDGVLFMCGGSEGGLVAQHEWERTAEFYSGEWCGLGSDCG